MSSMYSSTKIIDLGSCAFRQPFASSHCKYLHGYKLTSKFWFSCNTVDENNWVVDFGSLKPLKSMLAQMFDHTVVVWDKDPALQTFKELNNKSLIDIRIMTDGVGIEKFAQYCFEVGDKFIREFTNERCWVSKVEVWEHPENSAIYKKEKSITTSTFNTFVTQEYIAPEVIATSPYDMEKIEDQPQQPITAAVPAPQSASMSDDNVQANLISKAVINTFIKPNSPPLYGTKSQGYSDLFKGTSWGNNAGPRK